MIVKKTLLLNRCFSLFRQVFLLIFIISSIYHIYIIYIRLNAVKIFNKKLFFFKFVDRKN